MNNQTHIYIYRERNNRIPKTSPLVEECGFEFKLV